LLYDDDADYFPTHKVDARFFRAHLESMNRVVVVDDDEPNLKLYTAVVKRVLGEDAVAFENPLEALERLSDLRPSLVIVDYQMPELDGLAFIRELREMPGHAFTPIVMLTASGETELGRKAVEAGATLFLEKPIAVADLTAHLRHYAGGPASRVTYGEVVMPTDERDTILRLHRTLQAYSRELAAHAVQVRDLAVAIANELQLSSDEIEAIRMGALVYDIGMLAVPEKVREMPSALPMRWRSVVNAHVDAGGAILGGGRRPLLRAAETMARYHHERFDGTGYPEGLGGAMIPLAARILAVADTYVALVSERPHRVEFTSANAVAQIVGLSGTAFDPNVVAAFERLKDKLQNFPRSA
jgi:two-component system, response regulator RpfG